MAGFGETGLWRDVAETPATLRETLADARGFEAVVSYLTNPGVRRIIVAGNGAAYYSALALWHAAVLSPGDPPELVVLSSGMLAPGRFAWRDGDALLLISTSGKLRDAIEAARRSEVPAYALITGDPSSPLAQSATAVAVQRVFQQRAATHTQAFAGSIVTALQIWAHVSEDDDLSRAVETTADRFEELLQTVAAWAPDALASVPQPRSAIVFGSGCAAPGALELALLLKEVSRIPAEGVETREGATSAMFGLTQPADLAVSLAPDPPAADLVEAEELCAGAGATVIRAPSDLGDQRLAAIAALPAACAISAELALRAGHDVDAPAWLDAYYRTARTASP